jgi:hypothetical protein
MNFKHTKLLATVAVAALTGVVVAPSSSNAAVVTPTVTATLTTNSAITVVDGADMNFGTWFLVFRNADLFSLHLDTATGLTTAVGALGGTNSLAIETAAGSVLGTVTVNLPAGLNNVILNMQRSATTDMPDAGLTLNAITYDTAIETPTVMTALTNYPVTVQTGGIAETVTFGADVDVTATPADAVHVGSFTVSFAY